jgi:hypothetical protein
MGRPTRPSGPWTWGDRTLHIAEDELGKRVVVDGVAGDRLDR